jgi:hypothetical protein
MPDEKEIEEIERELAKLIEEEKKKKKEEEVKKEVPVVRMSREERDIYEKIIQALPRWVDVEVSFKGDVLRFTITPTEEGKKYFEIPEPLVITIEEMPTEGPSYKKRVMDAILYTLSQFTGRLKLPAVIEFEMLARQVGRKRAIELFTYLCQQGSAYHCSFLNYYLCDLITKTEGVLNLDDASERAFLADYVRSAGFDNLADILTDLDVGKLSAGERARIGTAVCEGIKRVLGEHATVYPSPDTLSEDALTKSWKVIDEAVEKPSYEWYPTPVDEAPVINALKGVAKTIPLLELELEQEAREEELEAEKEAEEIEEEEERERERKAKEELSELEDLATFKKTLRSEIEESMRKRGL